MTARMGTRFSSFSFVMVTSALACGSGRDAAVDAGLVVTPPTGMGGAALMGAGGAVVMGTGGAVVMGAGGAVVMGAGGAVVMGAGGAVVMGTGGAVVPPVGRAGLFPATAPWYQDVSGATLDAESAAVITGLGAKGGWGLGRMQIDFSIEVLAAQTALAPRMFTKTGDFYDPDCDFVPMPVPPLGRVEGEKNYACTGDGDCHLIVLQGTKLFEMWRADIAGGLASGGLFRGGCLAVWDTTKDYWKPALPPAAFARGDQCTSADAAGYPIAPLLFTADEVKSGEIKHAIRFILPNNRIRKGEYVHPATHSGAGKGSPTVDSVPYGARLRLKATFDLNRLPTPGAKVLARALQRYGMFLADGGNVALTGQADTLSTAKWEGLLGPRDLAMIMVSDFEMVDGGKRIALTLDCKRSGF